jgi:DNA-binding MarR family transcriptional regulator
LGPRDSFWNVIGPAEAPKFPSPSRTRVEPEAEAQAKVGELVAIFAEIIRLDLRCRTIFARIRQEGGLSGIEVTTLMAIAHAPTPPTVPQIGRSLGHPRQVIQRAVRVLEEHGLMRLAPNPGHKRAALLVATEQGRALQRMIDAQAAEVLGDVAEGLDLEMLAALSDGLHLLRERIDERMSAERG